MELLLNMDIIELRANQNLNRQIHQMILKYLKVNWRHEEFKIAPTHTEWKLFSPVETQQLTRHLGKKHCLGVSRESNIKSKQTLNTRYDLKIIMIKVDSNV
uniref:Uncharacterized protein n=1 Tax=Glycine max TaxID=3847 RepID=A0A0R0KKD2_SOYBN